MFEVILQLYILSVESMVTDAERGNNVEVIIPNMMVEYEYKSLLLTSK